MSKWVFFIVTIHNSICLWLEFSGGWLESSSSTTTEWVCSKWIGSSFSTWCCLSSWLLYLRHCLLHLRLALHLRILLRMLIHHLRLCCIHLLLHHHLLVLCNLLLLLLIFWLSTKAREVVLIILMLLVSRVEIIILLWHLQSRVQWNYDISNY